MNPRLHRAAAAALLTLAAASACADELPESLLSLFKRLPEPPATAQEATRWVDPQGRLVHPGLLALKAALQAHQQAVNRIAAPAVQREQTQAAIAAEDLGKGMADAGIDMARLQRDPAYAQQVQDRLRKMSPQEAMAFSQRMSQPLNSDPRHQNAARALAEDAPAAKAAAAAGEAYTQAQPARLQAQQALWREAEKAAAAILQRPLKVPAARPAVEWESIGCNTACRAQWDAYAAQVLPLMIQRDTDVLQVRRSALQRQRAALADALRAADGHLVATRYGAASQSAVNQMKIIGYDSSVTGDLSALIERMTDTARSAAAVAHCGKQIVLAPQAVCQQAP
jgi:hypothetical protein